MNHPVRTPESMYVDHDSKARRAARDQSRDSNLIWWLAGILLVLFLLSLYSALDAWDLAAQLEEEAAAARKERESWQCEVPREKRGVLQRHCIKIEGV